MYGRIVGGGNCCTPSSSAASLLRHAVHFPFVAPFVRVGVMPSKAACGGETGRDEVCETPTYRLAVDIHEETRDGGKMWLIKANVPGFKKEEISLEVKENVLSIEAKRTESVEGAPATETKSTVYLRERRVANLIRQVRLPENAATDGIAATLVDGVLTVTIPQVPEAQPRKVPLN